jgi:hypothetical protein
VQLFVVGLTFARHVWATRSGWGGPLFSLLSREGTESRRVYGFLRYYWSVLASP